jgi:hypothetical protein
VLRFGGLGGVLVDLLEVVVVVAGIFTIGAWD